jgi:hypothetical protein
MLFLQMAQLSTCISQAQRATAFHFFTSNFFPSFFPSFFSAEESAMVPTFAENARFLGRRSHTERNGENFFSTFVWPFFFQLFCEKPKPPKKIVMGVILGPGLGRKIISVVQLEKHGKKCLGT